MTTCDHPAHGRLLRDVVKLKARRDELLHELERAHALLDEQRRDLVHARVAPALQHVDDFDRFVGVENVIDDAGHIDWSEVDIRTAALLATRPELGRSTAVSAGRGIVAVDGPARG